MIILTKFQRIIFINNIPPLIKNLSLIQIAIINFNAINKNFLIILYNIIL